MQKLEPQLVAYKGGPVYVESMNKFFPTLKGAAEAWWDEQESWDEEKDSAIPATVVVHPCDVGKAHTPNLLETIEEAWGASYDDPEAADLDMPPALTLILAGVQTLVEDAAPSLWTPRSTERVDMAPYVMLLRFDMNCG